MVASGGHSFLRRHFSLGAPALKTRTLMWLGNYCANIQSEEIPSFLPLPLRNRPAARTCGVSESSSGLIHNPDLSQWQI